jgi:hypothetical protein
MYIYIIIVLIIVAIGYRYYLNLPTTKGKRLEAKIDTILKKMSLEVGGFEFRDYMIPYGERTSQIDNIFMSQKAIYVIEAKNYQGFIFGSESQASWTLTRKTTKTYTNKRGKSYQKSFINKYPFYSPMMQNQTHIEALKKLMNTTAPIYNIVVFSNKALLKDVKTNSIDCINVKDLYKTIKIIESKLTHTISLDEQIEIVDTLFLENITSKKLRKLHVKYIQKQYQK